MDYTRHICTLAWIKATNNTYTNKPINVHFCPCMYNREHQGTKAIPNSLHSWKLKKGEPLNMYFLKKILVCWFSKSSMTWIQYNCITWTR